MKREREREKNVYDSEIKWTERNKTKRSEKNRNETKRKEAKNKKKLEKKGTISRQKHHAHGSYYENKHKCQLTTLIIKQWLKL